MNLLFLGDSITDCDHCFTADNLGNGFVKYIAEQFNAHTVTNGGTDGFTFPRILQKWERMYRGGSYDIVIILGGINDVAVAMDTGLNAAQSLQYLSSSEDAFRDLLHGLISDGVKQIIVIEPFLFDQPDWLTQWKPGLTEIKRCIRRAANTVDFPILLLSVQENLNVLSQQSGTAAVSPDGIHLTASGHRCIADLLIHKLGEFIHET